ncbi:MAG: futalosine hydrolase [Desulfovibrionaceae bacterium]|nr:futalosine hydrolase [Desulfovibrionaceae bacterium]
MAILLCAATPEELSALLSPHPKAASLEIKEQEWWHIPPKGLGFSDIYALCTGIGLLNASLALGRLLASLKAEQISLEKVLVAGLAGAFNLDKIPLESFCVVREEIWPEYGLHDGHEVIAQAFKWPQWTDSPQGSISDRIKLEDLASYKLKPKILEQFLEVSSLTVAGVSASFARAHDLWDCYHAELENMEGFALAFGCLREGLSCTEIRCISNKVGPRKSDEKDFPWAINKLKTLLPLINLA